MILILHSFSFYPQGFVLGLSWSPRSTGPVTHFSVCPTRNVTWFLETYILVDLPPVGSSCLSSAASCPVSSSLGLLRVGVSQRDAANGGQKLNGFGIPDQGLSSTHTRTSVQKVLSSRYMFICPLTELAGRTRTRGTVAIIHDDAFQYWFTLQ